MIDVVTHHATRNRGGFGAAAGGGCGVRGGPVLMRERYSCCRTPGSASRRSSWASNP